MAKNPKIHFKLFLNITNIPCAGEIKVCEFKSNLTFLELNMATKRPCSNRSREQTNVDAGSPYLIHSPCIELRRKQGGACATGALYQNLTHPACCTV
jgi:hypothetical protein